MYGCMFSISLATANYVLFPRDEEALADLNQADLDGTLAAAYAERGAILQKLLDPDRGA